jgi:hypothetical protein
MKRRKNYSSMNILRKHYKILFIVIKRQGMSEMSKQ